MSNESLYRMLAGPFAEAIAAVSGRGVTEADAAVRPAGDPKFGDYQCNAAMSLAKDLKARPREIAQRIREVVEPRLAGVIERLEIAGPGFLNVRFRDEFLASHMESVPAPPVEGEVDRVGLGQVARRLRVVVEYSQPNIAKQMHVGHLRGTVIGDVFARVLAFQGHDVIRQNHIGDWGTQFGMLIHWYREHPLPTPESHDDVLEAIEQDYKKANERFKKDAEFARDARLAVGQLQSGEPEANDLWMKICDVSLDAIDEVYTRLGVLLRPEDVRGESFYNDRLQPLVDELRRRLPPGSSQAEVKDDQGAVCVFLYDEAGEPQFRKADGEIQPLIIQKSDGAFLYSTTDLAAIRFRLQDLEFPTGRGAERVIYVTDARQKLHFEMWMAAARAAGWIDEEHRVEHVTFGSVQGPDRRPLQTREGGTVRLRDLLDEAERRAYELLKQRGGDEAAEGADSDEATLRPRPEQAPRRSDGGGGSLVLGDEAKREVARRVGIAAVKYADLRNDRDSDYVFTWDKMISFQGNTAPYMMYAYARIRSIYRRAAERIGSRDVYAADVRIELAEPAERALALRLARLPEVIDVVATDLVPHVLCAYLYDLATDFMRFYETCPVLQAEDEARRLSRMRLCDLTARTLRLGLGLLGIEVLERM